MKIAIFHDYFDEIGGAEITLLYLARELKATILTTNINRRQITDLGFQDIKMVSIGKVPQTKHLKQLFTQLKFSKARIKGFDFCIFGGPYSIYASKNHSPNLWYCFSPQRGLYDLRYLTKGLISKLKQPLKEIQIHFDKKAIKNIQKIIAPSENVKKRIRQYYNIDSRVIYSPINTKEFTCAPHKNYWLSVLRIDPYKRIELQLAAFSKLKDEKLIIAGGASEEFKPYLNHLKRISPVNVSFAGPVFDRKKLAELYSNCKGFITTSKNEDFGMTPVEAMASGKPVIAPNEGGYKETVIDGVTGKLIDNIDTNKLVEAIKEVGKNAEKYRNACIKQAKKFDTSVFIKKMKEQILSN